eukprot:3631878-Rhodomonas_salina.1
MSVPGIAKQARRTAQGYVAEGQHTECKYQPLTNSAKTKTVLVQICMQTSRLVLIKFDFAVSGTRSVVAWPSIGEPTGRNQTKKTTISAQEC